MAAVNQRKRKHGKTDIGKEVKTNKDRDRDKEGVISYQNKNKTKEEMKRPRFRQR